MPRISDRQQCLDDVAQCMEVSILSDSSDDDFFDIDSLDEIHDFSDEELSSSDEELDEFFEVLISSRYLQQPDRIPKSRDYLNNFYLDQPPAAFRQMSRMDKLSFFALLRMIEDHSIFKSESNHSQAPVWIQLAVALDRFGHEGNGACISRSLLFWGIGHGTLVNYTQRVMTAIESTLNSEIRWPNSTERKKISSTFAKRGFPGCIGLIDGTLIPLSQRPRYDGEVYFDRKQNYSLNAQIICDEKRRILYIFCGLPGSCHDWTCLRRSPLWSYLRQRSVLFSHGEYLLGDSAYNPGFAMSAFRTTSGNREKSDFNTCVAHARVANEHCIGILKSRWHSLRRIRTQLKQKSENAYVVRWIQVCAILHNFLLNRRDEWTPEDGLVIEVDNNDNHETTVENDRWSLQARVVKYALEHNRRPGGCLRRQ